MVVLKDEADVSIAKVGQVALGQGEGIASLQPHVAARRPVERAENVQQRALAGAGRPHDGHGVAALQVERHIAQHGQGAAARRVILGEMFNVEGHRWHFTRSAGAEQQAGRISVGGAASDCQMRVQGVVLSR